MQGGGGFAEGREQRTVRPSLYLCLGRADEAGAMIEAAAGRMNKITSDFEELLVKRRMW